MNVLKVLTNGRSWLIKMLGKLIPRFILCCSIGTSQGLLSQGVAGVCWKERRWGEEKLRESFHTAVYIEKNHLTGSVFCRFHSPNYTDFPLQSSPFFFPFPLVSAFISFLNFCFLFTPHCHFDVCASFRWIFFVCSNKILYPRCHLSGRFHCKHRV